MVNWFYTIIMWGNGMKEVFISYSTKDVVQAETVREVLEKNSISCWMAPRDIPGGSNYTKEIPNAIRGCKIFVLILSENAQGSPWVLRELDSAVNSGKVILPFMLEDCDLNDEFNFLLTGAQRYAAYQRKAEVLEKLVSRIHGVLDAEGRDPEPVKEEEDSTYRFSFVQPSQEPKQEPVQPDVFIAVCPACGSTDIKKEPKKLIPRDNKERFLVILSWLLALPVATFLAALVGVVGYNAYWDNETMEAIAGLSMIAAPFITTKIMNKHIRTKRLQQRKQVEACRCNRCSKKFNDVKEL